MKNTDFKKLLDSSRHMLAERPSAYARRLSAFAFLGLAYPYAIAAFCLVGAGLCIWGVCETNAIMLAVLAGLFLGFLIRFASYIYFAMRPPGGVPVAKTEAPKLFAEIEAVSKAVGARPPDAVFVNASFNAGAASLPGRFMLSPGRNYLILGYPLFLCLDKSEFRSVLAHEMAHFSLSHPASSRLSWRALDTWSRIGAMLQNSGGLLSRLMLGHFAAWYMPRLHAMASANSVRQEQEADSIEASVAGREVAARALCLHSFQARRLLSKVLRPLWEQARSKPEPPPGLFKALAAFLRDNPISPEELAVSYRKAMAGRSIGSETHPSTGERLAALGFDNATPDFPAHGENAAQTLLGSFEKELAPKVEEHWIAESRPGWTALNAEAQSARRALSTMLNMNMEKANSLDMLLQRARLLELASGPEAALRPFASILEAHPDCHDAKFSLGRIKTLLGDASGPALMLDAMNDAPALLPFGFGLLDEHFRIEGLPEQHARLLALQDAAPDLSPNGLASIAATKAKKPETQPPLPPCSISSQKMRQEEMAELLRVLAENGKVEKAYLALASPLGSDGGKEPFHALLVVRRFSLLAFRGETDTALAKELAGQLSKLAGLRVIPFDECPVKFKLKVKFAKGSLIFKA